MKDTLFMAALNFEPRTRALLGDTLLAKITADAEADSKLHLENTAVFFDLDGTLVNTIPLILAGFRHCFAALNYPYPGDAKMQATIGMPLMQAISLYVPAERVEEFNLIYEKYHKEHLKREISLYKNAYAQLVLLQQLKPLFARQGKALAAGLFTSRRRWSMEIILQNFALEPFFDLILAGDEVEGHKPAAEPLLYCVDVLQKRLSNDKTAVKFQASNVFYVGDAYFDLACANSAGYHSCLVDWTQNAAASFQGQKADFQLKDANDLYTAIFTNF